MLQELMTDWQMRQRLCRMCCNGAATLWLFFSLQHNHKANFQTVFRSGRCSHKYTLSHTKHTDELFPLPLSHVLCRYTSILSYSVLQKAISDSSSFQSATSVKGCFSLFHGCIKRIGVMPASLMRKHVSSLSSTK